MTTEDQRYYQQWNYRGHTKWIRGHMRYYHCSNQLCCWGPHGKLDKIKRKSNNGCL